MWREENLLLISEFEAEALWTNADHVWPSWLSLETQELKKQRWWNAEFTFLFQTFFRLCENGWATEGRTVSYAALPSWETTVQALPSISTYWSN